MDIPNDRSSHKIPTPRGGGISIVITFLVAISFLYGNAMISLADYSAFMFPGILLAIVSYIDDRRNVSPILRLLFQIIAASMAVYFLGGVKKIHIVNYEISLPFLLSFLAIIGLVWLINLYNFMDGIDGIAGLNAVSVSVSFLFLIWITETPGFLFYVSSIFIASVAGFLWFNFPKASIFMGDIGSCFLGLVLGLFILEVGQGNQSFYWAMLILLGMFILDATITLTRRAVRGQKIYMAHREHAYQHLSRKWNSHPKVTLLYSAITFAGLLPIAVLVVEGLLDGFVALLIAYCPLSVWLWSAGAGTPQIKTIPQQI